MENESLFYQKDGLRLISNFVHQIIHPLNGVIGILDNIIDGTIDESRREQRTKAAKGQLEALEVLIRNLAFFAELSATNALASVGKTSKICVVPQVVIESAMFFQEQAANKGIKIELVNRHEQFSITGNPDLLKQVFMNIFDNYVKYGLDHSTVTVEQRVQKKSNDLLIEISGQCIAFDNASSETLFNVGVRGDEAKKVLSSGTGLGLYICKEILGKVFNGEISAEYAYKSSTSFFRIYFSK